MYAMVDSPYRSTALPPFSLIPILSVLGISLSLSSSINILFHSDLYVADFQAFRACIYFNLSLYVSVYPSIYHSEL